MSIPNTRVETCVLCADGAEPPLTRFINPQLREMGHLRFVQEVILPTMSRHHTTSIEYFNPWGWSAGLDDKPVDPIDLDARRLCFANPATHHIGDIESMVAALSLLKSFGNKVAIYIGSPYAAQWHNLAETGWDRLAHAIANPFKGLVDRWDVDMLNTSNGNDAGSMFAKYLAKHAHCEIGGEPRPLTGKVAARVSICQAGKWRDTHAAAGDADHLPLAALGRDSEVHIISDGRSLTEARAWVGQGAFYMLGPSDRWTGHDFVEPG